MKLLLSLSFFLCSDALTYYISPDPVTNGTCNDSGSATLRPCYSFQQLSIWNGLLFNKSAITLLLLSGTHVLPESHTLILSDIREVEISPWKQQQEELIECHSLTNIVFEDIQDLRIFSLNFTSCIILSNSAPQVVITNCVFADSKKYAIEINSRNKINVSIDASIFLSNNGAISCSVVSHRILIDNSVLVISNTMFLNNWKTGYGGSGTLYIFNTDLKLQESLFINNTAFYGAAIVTHYSSALIINTNFLNNSAATSGGAISHISTSLSIYTSLFSNNSAEKVRRCNLF